MPDLHFNITGDCTGAVQAVDNAKSAVASLAGTRAEFAISATGVDKAMSQLAGVGAAVGAASGTVQIGADTRGLGGAQSTVDSLRGGVQGLTQDVGTLGGLDVGVGGGQSLREMAGHLSGLSGSLAGASSGLSDFSRAGSDFSDMGSRVTNSASDMQAGIAGVGREAEQTTGSLKELQSTGAQVMNSAGGATPTGGFGGGRFGGSGGGGFGGFNNGPGGPDGPPITPPGGRGGAGGGGVGGGGLGDAWGAAKGLAGPAMMGGMIGGAESLITGAAGLMAVNEAIKQTPDLAYAANGAMQQFDKGIRQAATSAIAEGVPALHQLGQEMRYGLGTEVGTLGAEHMGTALGSVANLAGNATTALQMMDPAIESSIKGLTGLGDAVLTGLSSPGVVTALKGVGDALSDPKNDAGIASLVSGLSAVSGVAATVVANVAGLTGGDTGRASNDATGGLTGGLLGKSVLGGKSLGSKAAGFGIGAGILGLATDEQQRGIDPTGGVLGGLGATLAGKAMGLGGPGLAALAVGGEAAGHILGDNPSLMAGGAFTSPKPWDDRPSLTNQIPKPLRDLAHQASGGNGISGLWNNAVGTAKDLWSSHGTSTHDPGLDAGTDANGSQLDSSGFPLGVSAPHGWDRDSSGSLTPAKAPTSFDRELSTQASARLQALQTLKGAALPQPQGNLSPGSLIPRGGQGMGILPQNAAQQLQQANTGMQSLAQTTSSVAPPMQQLGQLSSTSGVQMAQMAQHTQAQAAAVQTLNQVTRPTMSSLNQLPQQAQQSMAQAQSSLVSGGNQMGAVMPQSMAGGISSGQSQVCNASQQLSQGAADCASSALGIQSPSRVFMGIGAQTGAGMALGIAGSSGVAAGAAGTAMLDVASVASNYAKDAGLALGHVMGTNLASGINTSITQASLKATGLAQGVDSPLAKMVLGQMGLLGKAGGGAQSWDLLNNAGVVSFGSGTPAEPVTPNVTVHVQVEGTPMRVIAQQVMHQGFQELDSSLGTARR